MKAKILLALILFVGVLFGFWAGLEVGRYSASDHYEFHVGSGALAGYIWRCDKRTGKVTISYGVHGWHAVPEPWQPPKTDEIIGINSITNAPAGK